MTQRKYVIDLVTHVGLLDTKPTTPSLDPNAKLSMDVGDPLSDQLSSQCSNSCLNDV